MIWWCRSDPINFLMPYSQIADLTLTLCLILYNSFCYCFKFFYFKKLFSRYFLWPSIIIATQRATCWSRTFGFCVTALQMTENAHWTVCWQLSDSGTHRHCWYFTEIWRLLVQSLCSAVSMKRHYNLFICNKWNDWTSAYTRLRTTNLLSTNQLSHAVNHVN